MFNYKGHKDDLIKTIKSHRVELNVLVQHLQNSNTLASGEFYPQSRELDIAQYKLEEARMWLGKYLAFLGDQTPYTEADNPTNAVVSPTADLITHDMVEIPVNEFDQHLEHMADRMTEDLKEKRSLTNDTVEQWMELALLRRMLEQNRNKERAL